MSEINATHEAFTAWCGRRYAAGTWGGPIALAATRVRCSLQVCAQDPERASSVRMLGEDVADLKAALATYRPLASSH